MVIAYLRAPRSSAAAERSFSLLGHIQTDDRLNIDACRPGVFIFEQRQSPCDKQIAYFY